MQACRPLNPAFHSFEAPLVPSSGIGLRAYLAVFAATAAGYMGIPIIGTAGPAPRRSGGTPEPGISRDCCPRFT